MAGSSSLNSWLLENADALDLRVQEGVWLSDWLPGAHEYRVEIKVDGVVFAGQGASHTQELAFSKAVAESIERAIAWEHQLQSTNGLAVHPVRTEAARFATRELIERDLFLCHYLTKTQFYRCSAMEEYISKNECLIKRLRELKVEYDVVELTRMGTLRAALVTFRGTNSVKPFGLMLGFGIFEDIKQSVTHAMIEAVRNLNHFLAKPISPIQLDEFLAISDDMYLPEAHYRLAIGVDYLMHAGVLFERFLDERLNQPRDFDFQVEHSEFKSRHSILASAPVVAMRANSQDLQQLYWGKSKSNAINVKRLSQFLGETFDLRSINIIPHPFD